MKDIQTMMQDQILETLENLKDEVHKRYKAELKGIFGSYTRGEARENSDIPTNPAVSAIRDLRVSANRVRA